MSSDDRPDLSKKRSGPRPADVAGRDPVDTPVPQPAAHRPKAKVLRQFRLSEGEDDQLMRLQQALGDQYTIDTLRWLLSLTPGLLQLIQAQQARGDQDTSDTLRWLLSGEHGIDPTQEPTR